MIPSWTRCCCGCQGADPDRPGGAAGPVRRAPRGRAGGRDRGAAAAAGLLQADGYTVYAPPNPLSGLANDSATLADFLKAITGPIILVGHSYGGMVITNAATGNPNVKALVYIDAFIPAQGETAFGLTAAWPGSCLDSANAFTAVPYPGGPNGRFRRLPQGRSRRALPGVRPVLH